MKPDPVFDQKDPSTWRGGLSQRGWELPDPRPMSLSLRLQAPPTIQELMQHIVRTELSRRAEAEGIETFDEADDFDVGDDYDPRSPYELSEGQFDEESPRLPDSGAPASGPGATPPAPPAPAGPGGPASPAPAPSPGVPAPPAPGG